MEVWPFCLFIFYYKMFSTRLCWFFIVHWRRNVNFSGIKQPPFYSRGFCGSGIRTANSRDGLALPIMLDLSRENSSARRVGAAVIRPGTWTEGHELDSAGAGQWGSQPVASPWGLGFSSSGDCVSGGTRWRMSGLGWRLHDLFWPGLGLMHGHFWYKP